MKMNCWEIMKCGRGPNGDKIAELGECPAGVDKRFSQLNSGDCSGRACWKVKEKGPDGKLIPHWSNPSRDCLGCRVFAKVRNEEKDCFTL
jgi:hypothetical protein